jgi:hypothetical protein
MPYYLYAEPAMSIDAVALIELHGVHTLEDAVAESKDRIVRASTERGSDTQLVLSRLLGAYVYEVADEHSIDLDRLSEVVTTAKEQRENALATWTLQHEVLRDELGHWRTLAARGQAPSSQVTLLEDRLRAHIAARP